MVGQLTTRARLRERRRLVTLLGAEGDPRSAAKGSRFDDTAPRTSLLDRSATTWRARRRSRKHGLTLLSLNRAEPEAPPSVWAPDPEITKTSIWLQRLPSVLDGLKIVHLTDIHHSLFTPIEDVECVVHLANRLEPDVVALTGDYVTLSPAYIGPVARVLGKLRARRGIFAVLGNHDFQVDAREMTRALRAARIRVLRNSRYPIRAGGKTLWFLGVDDLWWQSDDLPAALRAIPTRDPKVLLCHNPRGIWQASEHGIDLVLSGHTHGGQVRLPGLGSLYRSKLGERFLEGWNHLNGTQIYVSRGIGKVVVPLRLGCPPEIACLRLHRAS